MLSVVNREAEGDRTPDRSRGGLGPGLTLVKRLVEMYGGVVEVRNAAKA